MTYELSFNKSAMKEWEKLAPPIRAQFKAKLAERLENPHVPASRLSTLPNCYKIKLRSLGYRLVYQVDDGIITIVVIAVGKRENDLVYKKAALRVQTQPTQEVDPSPATSKRK